MVFVFDGFFSALLLFSLLNCERVKFVRLHIEKIHPTKIMKKIVVSNVFFNDQYSYERFFFLGVQVQMYNSFATKSVMWMLSKITIYASTRSYSHQKMEMSQTKLTILQWTILWCKLILTIGQKNDETEWNIKSTDKKCILNIYWWFYSSYMMSPSNWQSVFASNSIFIGLKMGLCFITNFRWICKCLKLL